MFPITGQSKSLNKVVNNLGWLLAEKLLKMGIGLVVTVLITRYLGLEKYGTFNYILAFALIFAPLANLGLEAIVLKKLIQRPEENLKILGTSMGLKFVLGLLILLFSAVIPFYLINGAREYTGLIVLASSCYLFQAFDVIDYYFQSKQILRRSVIARSCAFLISNSLKILALLNKSDISVFIWLYQFEFVLSCFFLILNYGKKIGKWRFDFSLAKEMLIKSWPIVLTSIAMGTQAYIDQIMLGTMIGHAKLSEYSVALTLVNAFGFIPMIVYTSTVIEITKSKQHSEVLFHLKLIKVYRTMIIAFLVSAALLFVASDHIIELLYGNEFEKSGFFLSIFSLRLLFVNLGTAKQLFIMNENLFRFQMYSSLAGLLLNIVLNYLLIPRIGAMGAYISIIISYSFTVFINDLFNKKMRLNLMLMIKSMTFGINNKL